MKTKESEVKQIRSAADLSELQGGDVVRENFYGLMRYQSQLNATTFVFIGRKQAARDIPALHFVTINSQNIGMENGQLDFHQPYEVDKVFGRGDARKYHDLNTLLTEVGI